MHWEPGDDWTALTAGTGVSNGGVWRTPDGFVVKRLVPGVERPAHYAYWRRQAEVARSGLLESTLGLRAPRCLKVETDPAGIAVWTEAVDTTDLEPMELAEALGRFALNALEPAPWFARGILRDRLANDEGRGGWSALASVPALAPELRQVCGQLWERRADVMTELDRLPQQVIHGDAHPLNLLRRTGREVVAADWEQFGTGPVGFDPAYLALSTDHPVTEVVGGYQAGSGGLWPVEVVRRGVVLVAAVTLVARAAWSLGQPEPGDHLERLVQQAEVVAEAVSHLS
ncbi:aminoglycoside phosphotransferase family protein [Kribbella sp. NPDC026611]|uniref:aminoglycoside phosphotransferase family protein n=1 Tax=Kribbella sp. NPDC026611 TaxID=3154911 RepID=UPI0033F5A881